MNPLEQEKISSSPETLPSSASSNGHGIEDFRRRLREEVIRSRRCSHTFTLMRLAVDCTKQQKEEDLQLEPALRHAIREYDVICSVNPTEYLIAFPETTERNAEHISERIRSVIFDRTTPLTLEASVGIACYPQDGSDAEDLLHSADQDLRQIRRKH